MSKKTEKNDLRALKSFDHSLAFSVRNMVKFPSNLATHSFTTVRFTPLIVDFLINWHNRGAVRRLGGVRPLGRLP